MERQCRGLDLRVFVPVARVDVAWCGVFGSRLFTAGSAASSSPRPAQLRCLDGRARRWIRDPDEGRRLRWNERAVRRTSDRNNSGGIDPAAWHHTNRSGASTPIGVISCPLPAPASGEPCLAGRCPSTADRPQWSRTPHCHEYLGRSPARRVPPRWARPSSTAPCPRRSWH